MNTERPPVTDIILGTMTLGYHGYGARVDDTETAAAMLNLYAEAGYRALDTAQGTAVGAVNRCSATWGSHNDSRSRPDTTRKARTTPKSGTSSKPPSG